MTNPHTAIISLRAAFTATFVLAACMTTNVVAQTSPPRENALRAFDVVRSVLQHPRCRNCHVTGDVPLMGDEGIEHDQFVVRGPTGHGAAASECSSCHLNKNLPVSYGAAAPPGSPGWHMPPPATRMVFNGLSPHELCVSIKDRRATGGKNLAAMMAHIRDNRQVTWGWAPGANRTVPPATRAETVAAFRTWMNAGAPCPM